MHLQIVDKLERNNIGVKYQVVRQVLSERTVDANRVETKVFTETVPALLAIIKKTINTKSWSTREQKLLEKFKNFVKLKKYKYTLQSVRLRLQWQNLQYDPWKDSFTVRLKIMDTSTLAICLILSQPWLLEKLLERLHRKNIKSFDFMSNLYSKPLQEHGKPAFMFGDSACISI